LKPSDLMGAVDMLEVLMSNAAAASALTGASE
jgi:hypothetical protein